MSRTPVLTQQLDAIEKALGPAVAQNALVEQVLEAWNDLTPAQQRRFTTLGGTIAAVTANAVVGSLATRTKTPWYMALKKPWFQPPAWVFPIAWTALYTDIAAVTGLSLADLEAQGRTEEFEELKSALGLNIALNVGWSVIFFVAKRPGLATLEAAALAVSSADLVRRTREVDPDRGSLLLPYALWTGFATVLTFGIWRRNRKNAAAKRLRKEKGLLEEG